MSTARLASARSDRQCASIPGRPGRAKKESPFRLSPALFALLTQSSWDRNPPPQVKALVPFWNLTAGMATAYPGVNARCVSAYEAKQETWRCLFAEYALPFISVPVFTINSLYDPAAMISLLDMCSDSRLQAVPLSASDSLVAVEPGPFSSRLDSLFFPGLVFST